MTWAAAPNPARTKTTVKGDAVTSESINKNAFTVSSVPMRENKHLTYRKPR